MLRKELEERLAAAQLKPEWRVLLADPDRLQEIADEQDGKHFILRTPATGVAGKVFQAIGVALPPMVQMASADIVQEISFQPKSGSWRIVASWHG